MIELLIIDFKSNIKAIASAIMIIFFTNIFVKNIALIHLITLYIILRSSTYLIVQSINDRSLFYLNIFPKPIGYIFIEKIIFNQLLLLTYCVISNFICISTGKELMDINMILNILNIGLINCILYVTVPIYTLSAIISFISIIYVLFSYKIRVILGLFKSSRNIIINLLFSLILVFILKKLIRKTDFSKI